MVNKTYIYKGNLNDIVNRTKELSADANDELIIDVLTTFGFVDDITGLKYYVIYDENALKDNPYLKLARVMSKLFPPDKISKTDDFIPYWRKEVLEKKTRKMLTFYHDDFDIHKKFNIPLYELDE